MARLYSTRFIVAHAGAAGHYDVPDGFIIVVRFVTAFNAKNFIPGSANLLEVNSGVTLWQVDLGQQQALSQELRVVVDFPETIEITQSADCDMTVSGYLLSAP